MKIRKTMDAIDYNKIESIEVDGIDTSDYPDFVDAFISYAEYNGVEMSDGQLDKLNEDGCFVYDAVTNYLY